MKKNSDKEEDSEEDSGTHDPRSLFEPDENVDTSAKESDFNSSFVEELTKEKKSQTEDKTIEE